MESSAFESRLVRRIYELRVLLIDGEYPDLFSCRRCKKTESLTWFSGRHHGMLCETCTKEEDAVYVDESTLYTMQYILSAGIEKLYTFAVSKEVLHKLEVIMDRLFVMQVPHKFQSLEILKTIAG